MNPRSLLWAASLLLALSSPRWAMAQSGLGTITGTVVDQSQSTIPGATIRIVEANTGAVRVTVTNQAGLFTIPSVVVGRYTVTISVDGFKTKQFDKIEISSFQQLSLGRVTLDIGNGLNEAIEVVANAEQLVTDSGVRAESISALEVADTPINGRNWATLLKIIPGANPTTSNAFNGREYSATGYADFRINGKSGNQTQINLDGGSIVDHGNDGKTTVAPGMESIEEISVLTNNYQAEYGNRGGTVVNIVTKSGTNQFHGGVHDYLRNEALNANTFANKFQGLERPEYRYNYFGANLGGPIMKDRLFFFYSFEKFDQNLPGGLVQGRVPTAAERIGDFSQTRTTGGQVPTINFPGTSTRIPNNILPQNLIDPLGLAILNLYPLPNNPNDPFGNNYIAPYEREEPRQSHTVKIDWNASEKSRFWLRYTEDGGTTVDRGIASNDSGIFPFSGMVRPRPDRAVGVGMTRVFSPNLVMEALGAWSFDDVNWLAAEPDQMKRSTHGLTGLPTTFPTIDFLPSMTIGTYPSWNFGRMPAYSTANEYQLADKVTYTRGTHVFKAGLQIIRNFKDQTSNTHDKGLFDFSVSSGSPYDTGYAPANVLVGALSRFQQSAAPSRDNGGFTDVHLFIQDTWKVRPNLTLDYGLRVYHVPSEHASDPGLTNDAMFVPSKYDPAKAPRYYVRDPRDRTRTIDPANPNNPVPASQAAVLLYTIVPNSGDPMNGLVKLGSEGFPDSGVPDPPFALLAPRAGFAWSVSDRMVVRGGFGWAYNREVGTGATLGAFAAALTPQVDLSQTSLGTLTSATVQPITPRAAYGVLNEENNDKPVTYDFSIAVQRQISSHLVLDVAYVGNRQQHQQVTFNLNAIPLGTAFDPKYVEPGNVGYNFAGPVTAANPGALPGSNTVTALLMRPYQGYANLNLNCNCGSVRYNGLQVGLALRTYKGLTLQTSYTLGKTTSETENTPVTGNVDWRAYTGYKTALDRTHLFSVNYTYDVPELAKTLHFDNLVGRILLNGWRVAHTYASFSGQDYSPAFTIQQANTTTNVPSISNVLMGSPDIAPRLVVVGNPNLNDPTQSQQFDPYQLAVPGIYPASNGTGERNFLTGLGTFANDISFIKRFTLQRTKSLELRLNLYNAFNNTRFTGVNNSIQYKAKGPTFAQGFEVFNTPEQLAARAAASGVSDPLQIFNQYRAGVGHVNLTGSSQPTRIIEIGMALKF